MTEPVTSDAVVYKDILDALFVDLTTRGGIQQQTFDRLKATQDANVNPQALYETEIQRLRAIASAAELTLHWLMSESSMRSRALSGLNNAIRKEVKPPAPIVVADPIPPSQP